jgi:membrane protein required for beta-lactamase induction
MNGRLKSFADIPRDAVITKIEAAAPPKQWVDWSPSDTSNLSFSIVKQATEALRTWLDARLDELRRERVAAEDIQVTHRGGRTVIRVAGVDRFEFKLKFTMEKS